MNGAQIVVESLLKEGVDTIYGIPGGVIIPLLDALHDRKDIRFLLTRHEQGAAHMADGFARATGRVGVCLATSGPGATNLVTGLATAFLDSIPMVAITGQVALPLIGNDAFQEVDITGITRPVTKHNYLVRSVAELPGIMAEAFHVARTGRPGPVLIDLPVDVQRAEVDSFVYPGKVEMRTYRPSSAGHPVQVKKAAEMIAASSRPVIYAGGGVIRSGASDELTELARRTGIPVVLTLMGLGAFPADDPLFKGMLGMHGTRAANYSVMEADLLVAVGARFDDRVTGKLDRFAPHARIVHIDIDPSSISKNVKVDVPVVGDVKQVLSALNALVRPVDCGKWRDRIEAWQKKYPLSWEKDDTLRPQFIIEEINRLTGGEAIIATEVGQHQMWTAQFYRFNRPNSLVTSGGLGTMGFGFPAAIGAWLGCPDRVVFDIAGDGSFQMNIQELTTAVINRIPVKVAILNNCYLGMVRQWQELFFRKRYAGTFLGQCTDFAAIARAYGARGKTVTRPEEVAGVLEEAIAEKELPFVIDFKIGMENNVYPMVPAGAALNEMIDGLA